MAAPIAGRQGSSGVPVLLAGLVMLVSIVPGCFGDPEDEDGLDAELENEGYEITVTGVDGKTRTYRVTSSPHEADEDHDGLDDFTERLERTDPRKADTDGDGLLDGSDVWLDADDPLVETWRGMGIVSIESSGGFRFLGERGTQEVRHGGDPRDADTDGDGLPDGVEVGGFTVNVNGRNRTVFTSAHSEDSDNDGLGDGFEREIGLDPSLRDTDGDGVVDFADINPWQDAVVDFVVRAFTIDDPPGGRTSWSVHIQGNMHGVRFTSAEAAVQRGNTYNGTAFDQMAFDVPDSGGEVLRGRHNVSFLVTFVSEDQGGEPVVIDVFSETIGSTSLVGRLHMLDGTLGVESRDGGGPWPTGGTFHGVHGTVTLGLSPVR